MPVLVLVVVPEGATEEAVVPGVVVLVVGATPEAAVVLVVLAADEGMEWMFVVA